MSDSNANVATIREIYDAYGRGDTELLMSVLTDDFEMHEHAPDAIPWGGIWKGREGMKDFFTSVTDNMTHEEYVCEGMIGEAISSQAGAVSGPRPTNRAMWSKDTGCIGRSFGMEKSVSFTSSWIRSAARRRWGLRD